MFLFLLSLALSREIPRGPRLNKNLQLAPRSNHQPPLQDSCDMCTEIVTYIEELLNNSIIDSEIATLVALACDAIPITPIAIACSFLVEHYVPLIIQFLDEGLAALDICNKIGFCSVHRTAQLRKLQGKMYHQPRALFKKDSSTCLMCTEVITYVENCITDDQIEEEVEKVVGQICDTFVSPYSTICNTFIKSSIPTIISWIDEGIQILDVCHRLGFCDETTPLRLKLRK